MLITSARMWVGSGRSAATRWTRRISASTAGKGRSGMTPGWRVDGWGGKSVGRGLSTFRHPRTGWSVCVSDEPAIANVSGIRSMGKLNDAVLQVITIQQSCAVLWDETD